jgi:hypothetical protein
VRVGAGDFDGDGRADILTGPGSSGGPHVRAFDGDNLSQVANFFAFEAGFGGGVFVAAPSASGGQPLRASTLGSGGGSLSQAELDQIVAAAISQWDSVSSEAANSLRRVRVRLADLPGAYLGLAYADEVLIDTDAAGHGWSTDGASPGIDLFTAVAHELGHVLGLDDVADDGELMSGELAPGHALAALDALFASLE